MVINKLNSTIKNCKKMNNKYTKMTESNWKTDFYNNTLVYPN